MIAWRQRVLDGLFVATEAVAWYLVLHVAATGLEQSYLTVIAERLTMAMSTLLPPDIPRARDVLVAMERAADRRRRELGVPVPGEGEAAPFTERAGAMTKANAAGMA